jgi:hypothetical protein
VTTFSSDVFNFGDAKLPTIVVRYDFGSNAARDISGSDMGRVATGRSAKREVGIVGQEAPTS